MRRHTAFIIAAALFLASAPSALGLGLVPVNVLPPAISGSAQQGQTLTCTPGTWLNSPTSYAYAWQRTGSAISGATSSTYTLTSADVGQAITCSVVASNASGPSLLPAVSAPVLPVALPVALVPVMTSPPVISGTAEQGQTLLCSTGAWLNSPTSYAYAWQRTGSAIGGATSSTYTITGADVNQAITCSVVAANAAGSSVAAVSAPVVPAAVPSGAVPVNTTLPSISGTPQQGQTVSCLTGSWTNSPTSYLISWERDGLPIAGATGSAYTLTAADVGQAVTCTVVAVNGLGESLPAVSLPILPAAPTTTGGSGSGGGTSGGGTSGSGSGSGTPTGGSAGTSSRVPVPHVLSFAVAHRPMIVRVKGRRRFSAGLMFTYRLDRAATVFIVLERRVGERWVMVTKLTVKSAQAGLDRLKFNGRVGKALLKLGSFTAIIAAADTGGWSNSRSLTFRVVRKRVATHRHK